MIVPLAGLSLLFFLIAFTLTKSNARYLLAGYNTLPEKEKEKVDLTSYIPFFRNFHLFLACSLFGLGLLISVLLGEDAGGIFLAVYPIVAYIFFIWKSKDFYKGVSPKSSKSGVIVLAVVLLGVLVLMYFGFKEDRLLVREAGIEIEGIYGEKLSAEEIRGIEIVNEVPEVNFKTNGFALANTYKGYFNTNEAGVVKLILNSDEGPYILIRKTSGEEIYYSLEGAKEKELYEEIQKMISGE